MAKEKNITAVTSVAAADFARVVTSAGASVKATFANVAKYIVETYNGSTVAGSAQSVKSALDSLNSKSRGTISSAYTSSDIVYTKVGNVCTVVIYSLKDLDGNTETAIGTLPSGYRPYSDAVVAYVGTPSTSGFARSIRITINTSGAITAFLYGSSMSGAINVRGTFTYSV